MQNRLLFITSRYYYQPVRDALNRMALPCETQVVSYDSFLEIADVYQKYAADYDACLVSGNSAKEAIELTLPNITKPLVYFQVGSDGLHRNILRLALEQQSLDFSRIAIDFLIPLNSGCMVSDYLAIEDNSSVMQKTHQWMTAKEGPANIAVDAYILEQLSRMWQEKAFDLVICQYSSIIPELEALGIPYRCPIISDRHLRQTIEEVLLRLELMQHHNNHPAIVQIFPRQPETEGEDQVRQIYDAVQKFVSSNLIDCVLQEGKGCCAIITSMKILRFLTNDFQECRLTAYLEEALDFRIAVGYGIGLTVSHATNNVQVASKEAKLVGKSFVVDTNGNLIGPLDSAGRMVISPNSLASASDIAKQCSLSAMTIQKLQSIVQNNGSDKITVPEMAQKLGTTIRNANRIMQNLCRGNVARPVYTQTTHSRGRPVQVYALDFESR